MSILIQDETFPQLPQESTLESVDEKNASGSVPKEQKRNEKEENEEEQSQCQRYMRIIVAFYVSNQFPLHILLSILLARAYPSLGADYLQPEITATWIAVAIIFFLSGMGLKTEEFSKAFQRLYFNGFVQFFNFGVVSIVIFAVSRLLTTFNMLDEKLADGMVICACLPMAINVVIVLTALTGADEAAAVFNATFGNIVGIFLSPVLILAYLGATGNISLGEVFAKLTIRVVVPLVIGQVVQKTFQKVREIFTTHKRKFKKVQEYCLVFIVYTVFCTTFEEDSGAGIGDVFLMILYQFLLMVSLTIVAWYSLRFLFHDEPELRVMALFGCVQKTVALGVPLIGSIYEGNPNVGLYTLPILIWHPMQLVLGSMLVPRLKAFIKSERTRLDAKDKIEATVVGDVEAQEEEEDASCENSEEQETSSSCSPKL
jgi:sodium/bile acid cotransporter 7